MTATAPPTDAGRAPPNVTPATVGSGGDADPRRWGMLLLLAVAELAGMSLWFAGNAVAPALAERWALTAAEVGGLTTAVQLGFVAGTAVSAMLNIADVVPGRTLFAVAALCAAACNAALVSVGSYDTALVTRFGVGFFLAGVYPPAMKMAATWFRARRGLAVGTVVGALAVGKATPYLVQSVLGAAVNATVLWASVAALAAGAGVWLLYRDGPYPFPRRPFSWGLVGDVVRERRYRLATGGYLGHMAELYSYWTWIPAFIAASAAARQTNTGASTSAAFIALLAFGVIAIGGAGCVWGGVVGDRLGRERLVILAMAASGACALVVGLTFGASWWLLAPVALAWGFFVVADSAQFSVLVTESVPAHAVGTALTLQVSLGFLLTTLTIQIVPPVVAKAGWGWAFPILAVGPVVGIWCIRRLIALGRQRPAAVALVLAALAGGAVHGGAQVAAESLATVRVSVRHDDRALANASVHAGAVRVRTDADGFAVLRVRTGSHSVVVTHIGYRPETLTVVVPGASTHVVRVARLAEMLDDVMISTTRSERGATGAPTRVDVLVREEVEEKMLMTPGDITMMLNETGGLRVQTTSPSLGGAHVRTHGLSGRYTLLLSDGLPLYGGQAGGLGLLQIPPMDLERVEVIKGAASALYGPAALGGVVNLISRRPAASHEREVLLNQSTRGGADAVVWLSGPLRGDVGYSLLAGAHRQSRRDIDDDGWTDLAGYERYVVRPRAYLTDDDGGAALVTAGFTRETRRGGTLPGRVAPDGNPFRESLETERVDVGAIGRRIFGGERVLNARASAMTQKHAHSFGPVGEHDRHTTVFGELALTSLHAWGTSVLGASVERDRYVARDVPRFDYDFTVPSLFVQAEASPVPRVALAASLRLDAHTEYGTLVHPRVSALVTAARGWRARVSVGSGAFAPTPFTEDTEVTGLSPVATLRDLRAERAVTTALDIDGPVAGFRAGATIFASRVSRALALTDATIDGATLQLVNARGPTRTAGADVFARWQHEPFSITATYTHVRATQLDVSMSARRPVPLTPRHAAGMVGMWEREGVGRVGFEMYYTGTQTLDDNPYRETSRAYVIVGFLAERSVGPVRVFVNAENIGDARQTRYDGLLRPTPGRGNRWTTDVWSDLAGRVINAGVRIGAPREDDEEER